MNNNEAQSLDFRVRYALPLVSFTSLSDAGKMVLGECADLHNDTDSFGSQSNKPVTKVSGFMYSSIQIKSN